MEWYSASGEAALERIEAAWPDAPTDNPELCGMLLDVAKLQVEMYAPARYDLDHSDNGSDPATLLGWINGALPPRLVYAQLQQAKNLYNAGRIVGDSTGADGFSFVPRPLSKEIQKIIRPQSGVASVL